jgi:hypothetical protein
MKKYPISKFYYGIWVIYYYFHDDRHCIVF